MQLTKNGAKFERDCQKMTKFAPLSPSFQETKNPASNGKIRKKNGLGTFYKMLPNKSELLPDISIT